MSHTIGNLIYGTYINLDTLKDEQLAQLASHFSLYELPAEFVDKKPDQVQEPTKTEQSDDEAESGDEDEAGEAKVLAEFDPNVVEPTKPQLTLSSDVREDLIQKVAKKILVYGFKNLKLESGRPTLFYYGYVLSTVDAIQGVATTLSKFKGHSVTKVQKKSLAQKVKAMPKPIRVNLRKIQHYSMWSAK